MDTQMILFYYIILGFVNFRCPTNDVRGFLKKFSPYLLDKDRVPAHRVAWRTEQTAPEVQHFDVHHSVPSVEKVSARRSVGPIDQFTSMTEGSIHFNYQGEEYQTWYKVVGNRTRTPLIVAHGGPVAYYNRIGNSRSTHLPSKPPSFWTIDLFITELVNLLEHFHFQEGFDFLGHTRSRVRRMWNASTGELSEAFPDDVQKGLVVGVADMGRRSGCSTRSTDVSSTRGRKSWCTRWTSPSDISVAVGMYVHMRAAYMECLDRVRVLDIAQDFVVEPLFRGIRRVDGEIKSYTHVGGAGEVYGSA
ncbi:hypothetical protein ARMGADRAFT_1088764 [Armillaria gallica]|uniref:Alpha/beta-hydrolase n=1 Tax=Armillaria gallica TaxID=47427 RepID=A0A2H3CRM5_ARMGA|nr:hypothetical protein ARMGADRAFT_1088764 [Armillaria gallica]